jgi:5S rRNA maturation endonuclease (ribonuclease M5)
MNETAYDRIVRALKENGSRLTDSGHKCEAQCPAHEDRNASLSITGIVGRVLLWCHAGCATRDVLDALRMSMADLYDERSATYRYDDGRTVNRYYEPGGRKRFRQDGAGTGSVLYHRDRLAGLPPGSAVFLVEGEADVHAIEAAGGIATTAPQGADSFHKVDVSPLTGMLVTVVVDRDPAGDKWAKQVSEKITGVAQYRLMQAKEGKDASDHIAAGYLLADFVPYELADPTPLDRLRAALIDAAGLDDIPDPEPLVGNDVLFRDSLVWLVGKPGCMKSFTALDLAACVGTGEIWQGYPVAQGPVLYLIAEGARGVRKRVRAWEKAMGQKMSGVVFLPVAVQSTNRTEWAALVALIREIRPALIVIDTQARVTVGVEENSNAEMGVFVAQAEKLREAGGACVVIVHHIGRNGDTGRGATTLDGALSTIVKISKEADLVTLECQKNKDGAEWDPIVLRAVPTADSLVLMPAGELATQRIPRWLHEWWATFETEPVSISRLVKSEIVTEPTFHRAKLPLIKAGTILREGDGRSTRYRLPDALVLP